MGINGSRKLLYALFVLLMAIMLTLSACSGADGNSGLGMSGGSDDGAPAYQSSESYGVYGEADSVAVMDAGEEAPVASAVQQTGVAAGFGSDQDNRLINRKLIYRADVTMEVDDYSKVQAEIRNLIQLSGGYLLEFSESRSEYEDGGTFVIKVPSSGFMSFLNRLEELSPEHYASVITGQDVTEEYVDLEARLRAKQITEQRLLTFMDQATRADELVEFSRELGNVQQEIERIKGRMRYLEQHVAFSTIEARVYERKVSVVKLQEQEEPPFGKRLTGAVKAVMNGISVVLQELIILIVASIPIVIVLGLIASPFYVWYRYRVRQDQQRRASYGSAPMTPSSLAPQETDMSFGTDRVGAMSEQGETVWEDRSSVGHRDEHSTSDLSRRSDAGERKPTDPSSASDSEQTLVEQPKKADRVDREDE